MAWRDRGSRHQRGYGVAWERLRRAILQRDSHLCQWCKLDGVMAVANQVDHITPKSQGGSDDPSNLQSLCAKCHKVKGTASNNKRHSGCAVDGRPRNPDHHWNQ